MPNTLKITFNGETHAAKYWAKKFGIAPSTASRRFRRGQKLDAPPRKGGGGGGKRAAPCWSCSKTSNGLCPWFSGFEPVNGWDATPTRISNRGKVGRDRFTDSYDIRSCPMYEPQTETTQKIIGDALLEELIPAIVQQAVDDWRRLCRGALETKTCSFEELGDFFRRDCAKYIGEEYAKRIWREMKQEKKEAGV